MKNELISYRNNIEYSFLSKGIDTYILLSDDGLEIANKSLKRTKEDFGSDYEEDLIKYSYKTRRELVKSLQNTNGDVVEIAALHEAGNSGIIYWNLYGHGGEEWL